VAPGKASVSPFWAFCGFLDRRGRNRTCRHPLQATPPGVVSRVEPGFDHERRSGPMPDAIARRSRDENLVRFDQVWPRRGAQPQSR
jgi:hypothetical protein